VGTDYGFTGQRSLDEEMGGLMDYRARFYSSALGRFIQPDSIVPNPSNPQSWNRFSYVLNNPVRYTDPTGHAVPCAACSLWNGFQQAYALGWTNFKTALSIAGNPQVAPADRRYAAAYVVAWGGAHVDLVIGLVILNRKAAAEVSLEAAREGSSDSEYDMTEDEFWKKRHAYEDEIAEIPSRARDKISPTFTEHDAADWAVQERKRIGIKYKDITPPDMREEIYNRNREIYDGDPYGPPNADWYRRQRGYSDQRIIEGSGNPGGGDIIPKIVAKRGWNIQNWRGYYDGRMGR